MRSETRVEHSEEEKQKWGQNPGKEVKIEEKKSEKDRSWDGAVRSK